MCRTVNSNLLNRIACLQTVNEPRRVPQVLIHPTRARYLTEPVVNPLKVRGQSIRVFSITVLQ